MHTCMHTYIQNSSQFTKSFTFFLLQLHFCPDGRYDRDVHYHFTKEDVATDWSSMRRWLFWAFAWLPMASDRH